MVVIHYQLGSYATFGLCCAHVSSQTVSITIDYTEAFYFTGSGRRTISKSHMPGEVVNMWTGLF